MSSMLPQAFVFHNLPQRCLKTASPSWFSVQEHMKTRIQKPHTFLLVNLLKLIENEFQKKLEIEHHHGY